MKRYELSKIEQIRALTQNGLYYLTDHADDEATAEGFDIYDIEYVILNGRMRRTWPKEKKYEVVGFALDKRRMGIICRITDSRKVRIITVYEDKPKD